MIEDQVAQLARAIRNAVIRYRQTGSPPTHRIVRIRRADFTLKYQEDPTINNFAPERIEEDWWDPHDQEQFQMAVVKQLAEYKSLESEAGVNPGSRDRFARSMAVASSHGLEDSVLTERVRAFSLELEGQPLPVTVTAFISGLSIDESPLIISHRFHLRRPTQEDVTECVVIDEYGDQKFPLGDTWFRVVMELVCDAVYTVSAQMEFLRTLEALRLFRVGGVATNRFTMRSEHSFSGGTLSGAGRHSRYSYSLSKADIDSLKLFLHDIVPLLPDPRRLDEGITEREIAYTRYRDGLLQAGPSERTITSAITALEALFLKTEPELTRRLAQRVSVFLRVLGTHADAQATYDNVSKGYKIRSTFIHGGSIKAKDRPDADSLAPIVLEYARECTLAFYQLTAPKDELLAKLDHAMIDPASVAQLASILEPIVHT